MSPCHCCGQALPPDLWKYDFETAQLIADGRTVILNRRQAIIMGTLLKRIGRAVHRDSLIPLIWGDRDLEDAGNSLEQEIYKLREAIRWTRLYIETYHGFGYAAVIRPYHPLKS